MFRVKCPSLDAGCTLKFSVLLASKLKEYGTSTKHELSKKKKKELMKKIATTPMH